MGSQIFKAVQQEYENKIYPGFKIDLLMRGKCADEIPKQKTDLDDLLQKEAIDAKKKELEKTILQVRLKDNSMLKQEFDNKLTKIKDKFGEITKSPLPKGQASPLNDAIEQMVGLVQKKVAVKTLH